MSQCVDVYPGEKFTAHSCWHYRELIESGASRALQIGGYRHRDQAPEEFAAFDAPEMGVDEVADEKGGESDRGGEGEGARQRVRCRSPATPTPEDGPADEQRAGKGDWDALRGGPVDVLVVVVQLHLR